MAARARSASLGARNGRSSPLGSTWALKMATRLVVLSARVVDGGGGSLAGCCLDAMVEVVDALVGEARHPSCRHLVGVLVLLVLDTRRPSRLAIISPSFDGGAGLAEAEPAANHTPEHGQTLP